MRTTYNDIKTNANAPNYVYADVSSDIISYAYKTLFKAKRGTYYAGVVGYHHLVQDLAYGSVPYMFGNSTEPVNPEQVDNEINLLRERLESWKSIALSDVKTTTDKFSFRYHDGMLLYLKSEKTDDLIGCGWYSEEETPAMSALMCAFIMYSLARTSNDMDFNIAVRNHIMINYRLDDMSHFDQIIKRANAYRKKTNINDTGIKENCNADKEKRG